MLKLYIGDIEYPLQKKSWIPTLDSVIQTQILKKKYLYNTIIIFKKSTNYDYEFNMTSDVLYTSSELDSITVHYGVNNNIIIPGYYDYYDGTYYYSYLCLYSNVFNLWNIENTLTDAYAIKYDQESVTIKNSYVLNEFRITKNVIEFIVDDYINNVDNLILPNQTSDTTILDDYWLVNCKTFELFDSNEVSGQSVYTFNGLLYNIDQSNLLAVPKNYELDRYNNLYLSNLCNEISYKSMSSGLNHYNKQINMIYGENVTTLGLEAFNDVQIRVINFPKLEIISESSIRNNSVLEILYLPGSLKEMHLESIGDTTETFTTINFGLNLGAELASDIFLQNCSFLDPVHLGSQFNNLAEIEKGSKTIYLNLDVYDKISSADLLIADVKGWIVSK